MIIGLVGCGSKKKDEPKPAAYLYDSKYFELKRKWADQNCDIWFILSAEHGLLQPHQIIEPYDTNIKDVDNDEWSKKVLGSLQNIISNHDEVVFLAGKDYIEPLESCFSKIPIRTTNLFRNTSGIGEQLSLLKEGVS